MMYQNENRYLPFSARRYQLNKHGEILDVVGNRIESSLIDGKTFVELDWVFGRTKYEIGLLVIVTYFNLKLSDHLWSEIEPLYIDGDCANTSPGNVTYRFKNGPLEVETHRGFYYIPHATRYGISRNGVLINIETGETKNWTKTKPDPVRNSKGGYHYSRVVFDTGRSLTIFRYRALCMVFKPYEGNVFDLVVNHIDGNPENDDLSNIEWSTYGENNKHALDNGLRVKVRPVIMKNLDTGEERRFNSSAECAKSIGYGKGDVVRQRIAEFPKIVRSDLLVFKYDDGLPWPELDLELTKLRQTGYDEDIAARNVFTGEIIVFVGVHSGEKITGVHRTTILLHLRDNYKLPVLGYNFRYFKRSRIDWPQHTKYHLQTYRDYPIKPPSGVIVINIDSREERYITSRQKACAEFDLSPSGISRLIRDQVPLNSRYLFKHYGLIENLRSD